MQRSQLPQFQFTKEGYDALVREREDLVTLKRPEAVEDLRKAREMGDLSENGYYKAARAKLSSIDSRLRRLALLIKYGQIMSRQFRDEVDFNTSVTVSDGKTQRTFTIVGAQESNPMEGKLSNESPIGRALMGKKIGDKVEITIPAGKVIYTIIELKAS